MMKSNWYHAARVHFDAASREHFSLFLRRVMASVAPATPYAHNWHVDAISAHLVALAGGEISRLVINLPPRMLKSTLVSVAWPAWLLGHNPAERIMAASYAQSLSVKHSTDCRAVMKSDWYRRVFGETQLSRDQNAKEKFTTTQRGYRRAVSVGGAAIGEGGNVLVVDDPINPLQASHRHQREAVNQWFDHTFSTRLDDKQRGCMVVVMQRLHPQDLSGYLLEKGGWEHLCLPAIAPTYCVITRGNFYHAREAGEVLHPSREPLALLERAQRELGSANFSAQYQQMPLSQAGSVIKREWMAQFRAEDVTDDGCVQSWDTGIKAGAQHDASACATFVVRDGVHHLLDMLVVRLEYPELKRLMIAHAARFNPATILVEDKASGQSLLQDLRRETSLPLIAQSPSGDKLSRLLQVTPLMEAGRLALPSRAPWLAGFEGEFFAFPDGAHDDQVDAVSQYLNWVRSAGNSEKVNIRRL
jgi:predicted phage terminase large subunit-like protein